MFSLDTLFDGVVVGQRGGVGTSGGAGVVLMDTDGQLHHHAYSLNYLCTNNTAEYDALILGLQLAVQMDIRRLLVKGDSLLIIQQVLGKFKVKEQQLVVCKAKVASLLKKFDEVLFEHIARSSNQMADALAVLGSCLLQLGGTGRPFILFACQRPGGDRSVSSEAVRGQISKMLASVGSSGSLGAERRAQWCEFETDRMPPVQQAASLAQRS